MNISDLVRKDYSSLTFPKQVKPKAKRTYHKFEPTEEQEKWLIENFAETPNDEIMIFLGCGKKVLSMLKKKYSLKKSKAYLKAISLKGKEMQNKSFKLGLFKYPKQGNKNYYFKKGNRIVDIIGEEADAERKRKIVASRKKRLEDERQRVRLGMKQRTKLKVVAQSRSLINTRYRLKKLGYVLDEDKHIAYWIEETKRNLAIEASKKNQRWYKFMEYGQN